MGARERARDSAHISDMQAVKNALRLYYNDHQSYPIQAGGILGIGMSGYMPSIMNLGYTYDYYSSNNGDSFILKIKLDSAQGDDDINSQLKCGVGATDGYFVVCGN